MVYANLEQRMAQSYIDLFPAFVPDEEAPVSTQEQKKFYSMIRDLYQLAFDEPSLFVPKLHEDDAYPYRYKSAYGKPQLILDMRSFIKAVNSLLQNMLLMGQGSDVKLNKREKFILSRLGITDYSKLPAAWVWMSTRDDASLVSFTYCLFDKEYSYASEIYTRMLGEETYGKLENWMLENGYKRFVIHDITGSECKLSLTISNPKWSKNPPSGGFEYKIKHTGVSVMYELYLQNPVVLGLCIPNGMKAYLEAFDSMDKELQEFVISRTKKCDNCRYCVQTDKSGLRPLAYMPINFEGEEHQLCTYFPGYNYNWESIDDSLAEMLIKMLIFMDKFAPDSEKN